MSTTVKSIDEKKPTEWTLFQKRVRTLTGLTPSENMKLCSFLKKSKDMLEWKDSEIMDAISSWRVSLNTEDPTDYKEDKKAKKSKEPKCKNKDKEAIPIPIDASRTDRLPHWCSDVLKSVISKYDSLEDKKVKEVKEAKEPKEDKKSKASEPIPSTAAVTEPPTESITSIEFHLLEAKKKVDTATAIAKKADEDAKKAVDKAEDAMKKALDLKAKAGIATAAATEAQALVIASQKEVDIRTAELEKASAAAVVVTPSAETETNDEPLHLRRKKAPKQIKTLVWNKYIGSDVAEAPCMSCRTAKISNRSFHCGHVIAESKGGDMNINNLRPVCADCNGSMGTRSMNEFTKEFFGWTV
jgi:hypothetical protein